MKTTLAILSLLTSINVAQAQSPEPRSGYVEQHTRGQVWNPWHSTDTLQPGAYRTRNGTVITGPAQSPGCGGGVGQYPCPDALYIPDDPRLRPCTFATGSGCVDH